MTETEYHANIKGLNIFFGAMIGVVMGNAPELDVMHYSVLLIMVASFVITILYVHSSDLKLFYALFGAGGVVFFTFLTFDKTIDALGIDALWMRNRLLPSLAVWLLLLCLIEYTWWSQEKGKRKKAAEATNK